MDSESECREAAEKVKGLQAALFPSHLSNTAGSYLANFLVKSPFEDDEEDLRYKIKECNSKEWFPNKDVLFTLQPPRWPIECQVLEERVRHISYVPPTLEQYYVPTGNECRPKPTGDECGTIVFQYSPISAVNYFSRSSVGGSKYFLSGNLCPEIDSLKFESRFESGNLARAIMITPNYYELHLRSDLYTNRHMQWYYFRITNTKKGFLYRFSIINCFKGSSLYNEGLKPLMYSKKDAALHSIGWRRCGQNIIYYSNDNVTGEDPEEKLRYTVTFTVMFPHDDDEVYLAQCYPYTYSDLQDYLSELSTHPVKSVYTTVRLLCKSMAGNNVYYLTITSPQEPGDVKKKKAIVVTARVHPGETPSSWMMKGFLEFITGDCSAAKELRDKFIFKVVPMLNPDGVIVGNNRCSLSAKDLNRQYRTVMRDAYPSIWYTKLMVRRLIEECGVAMYIDLHAHSRKHDMFIYGCENRKGSEKRLHEQVFPLMLHKNCPDKFSFESCKFRVQKTKEGTGRVVMWMMGISHSYTMEASFAGSTLGGRTDTHFTTQDYEHMGRVFCETLIDFHDEDPRKERLRLKILERLAKEGSNADEPTNIRLSDYSSDGGDTSSSSDEVGRDDDIVFPSVPPPSPVVVLKKPKSKSSRSSKSKIKSPSAQRKPLPICKATLKLSLSEKEILDSSSHSDTDSEKVHQKLRMLRRRRKKKSCKKKKKRIVDSILKTTQNKANYIPGKIKPIHDFSPAALDTEREKASANLSVFDLIPQDTLRSDLFTHKSRIPQPKTLSEKKNKITKQLTEVQARLFTLKNKLWWGVGNGDSPLSWGSGNPFFSENSLGSPQKKKITKKNLKNQGKSDKKTHKESKPKAEQKEKSSKNQNGLHRQTAVDLSTQDEKIRIRKSRSLPDTSSLDLLVKEKINEAVSGDDVKQEKKKKKKRGKFVKKAKVVSNIKIFTQKD